MSLLRFVTNGTAFVEVEPDTMWTYLGARRAFDWIEIGGRRGTVVTRDSGRPMVCTCDRPFCTHRKAVRFQMTSTVWDTEPAA